MEYNDLKIQLMFNWMHYKDIIFNVKTDEELYCFCENICSFCNGCLQRVLKKLEQTQNRLGKLMNA